MKCPICEKHEVKEKTYSLNVLLTPRDWDGEEITVDGLVGWYCATCDDYTLDPEQIRHNNDLIRAVRNEKS